MDPFVDHLKKSIQLADAEMATAILRVEKWKEDRRGFSPTSDEDVFSAVKKLSSFLSESMFIAESLLRLVVVHQELFEVTQEAVRRQISFPSDPIADRIYLAIRFAVRTLGGAEQTSRFVSGQFPDRSCGNSESLRMLTTEIHDRARVLENSEMLAWLAEKPTVDMLKQAREAMEAGNLVTLGAVHAENP